jgi:hypothetical protein
MNHRTIPTLGLVVATAALGACVSNAPQRPAYGEAPRTENTIVNNPPAAANPAPPGAYDTSGVYPNPPAVNNNTTVVNPPAPSAIGGGPTIIEERHHRRGILFHRHD